MQAGLMGSSCLPYCHELAALNCFAALRIHPSAQAGSCCRAGYGKELEREIEVKGQFVLDTKKPVLATSCCLGCGRTS